MLYFVLHVYVSQAGKTVFTRKRDLALYLKEQTNASKISTLFPRKTRGSKNYKQVFWVRADIYLWLRNFRKYRFCFHNHPHIYHTFVSLKNANQTVLPDKRASYTSQHLVMTMQACRKYQVISRIVVISLHREH